MRMPGRGVTEKKSASLRSCASVMVLVQGRGRQDVIYLFSREVRMAAAENGS